VVGASGTELTPIATEDKLMKSEWLYMSDRCYTDYTTRDIVTYKRDYALEQVKFCEQALSEFDKEGKK